MLRRHAPALPTEHSPTRTFADPDDARVKRGHIEYRSLMSDRRNFLRHLAMALGGVVSARSLLKTDLGVTGLDTAPAFLPTIRGPFTVWLSWYERRPALNWVHRKVPVKVPMTEGLYIEMHNGATWLFTPEGPIYRVPIEGLVQGVNIPPCRCLKWSPTESHQCGLRCGVPPGGIAWNAARSRTSGRSVESQTANRLSVGGFLSCL